MDRWATVHGVTKSWTWLSNRAVLFRTFTRKAHWPLLCPSCPQTKGPPRHVTGLHRNCFVKCCHFISSTAHDFGKRDQQMFLQGKFSFLQPLAWHPSKPLLSQDIATLGGSSCFCALKHFHKACWEDCLLLGPLPSPLELCTSQGEWQSSCSHIRGQHFRWFHATGPHSISLRCSVSWTQFSGEEAGLWMGKRQTCRDRVLGPRAGLGSALLIHSCPLSFSLSAANTALLDIGLAR